MGQVFRMGDDRNAFKNCTNRKNRPTGKHMRRLKENKLKQQINRNYYDKLDVFKSR